MKLLHACDPLFKVVNVNTVKPSKTNKLGYVMNNFWMRPCWMEFVLGLWWAVTIWAYIIPTIQSIGGKWITSWDWWKGDMLDKCKVGIPYRARMSPYPCCGWLCHPQYFLFCIIVNWNTQLCCKWFPLAVEVVYKADKCDRAIGPSKRQKTTSIFGQMQSPW